MHIITSGHHRLFREDTKTRNELYSREIEDDEMVAVMLNDKEFINISDYESGAYIKYMSIGQALTEERLYRTLKKCKNIYVSENTFILPARYARSLLAGHMKIKTVGEIIPVVMRTNATKVIPIDLDGEERLCQLLQSYLEDNCRDEHIAEKIDLFIKEAFNENQSV